MGCLFCRKKKMFSHPRIWAKQTSLFDRRFLLPLLVFLCSTSPFFSVCRLHFLMSCEINHFEPTFFFWKKKKRQELPSNKNQLLNGLDGSLVRSEALFFPCKRYWKSTWTHHLLMVFFQVSQEGFFFWGGGAFGFCYDVLFHTTSWFHARGDIYHPFPAFFDRSWKVYMVSRMLVVCNWEGGDQPKFISHRIPWHMYLY